jgi:hypothetical protein
MCWVCIALPFSSVAENEDHLTFNDTLVIKLTGQTQVRIIGESMLKIIAYTRADSLKNIFINDLNAALSKSESKQLPVKVFYLVHPNGNRRLKMKQEEYVDETFELSREEYVMTENLPKHELNLFDLRTGIVIQFYVNDTSDLKEIADLNLLAAINFALANKKEVKRNYRYDIAQRLGGFTEVKKYRIHYETIEMTPVAGITLVGNVPAPIVGAALTYNYRNKYNQEIFETGIKMSGYFFTDFSGGKFNKVYSNTGYDLFFLMNASPRSKDSFSYGVEGGFITKSPKTDGVFKGNPGYFGFLLEYKGFQYSFGFIHYSKQQSIPTIGVKLPF